MRIVVLVGTTKGRAAGVAERLAADLAGPGRRVAVVPMERADDTVAAEADALVVCTSTFGAGDVPLNARAFLDRIRSGDVPCTGLPVGFVGLGDRSFRDSYNGGWRRFAEALTAAGARPIHEALLFDAADVLPPVEAERRESECLAHWAEAFLAALTEPAVHTPRAATASTISAAAASSAPTKAVTTGVGRRAREP